MKSQRLNTLIESMSAVSDQRSLMQMLRACTLRWGFDHFAYLLLAGRSSFALSSYPEPWQKLYFKRAYQDLDPIARSARSETRLFTWSADRLHSTVSRAQANFLDAAASFGIASGVSIPVLAGFGKMAVLTFASSNTDLEIDTTDAIRASIAATLVHAQVSFLRAQPTITAAPKLSAQQATCLKWSSEGKTMAEIGDILGISPQSVRFHLDEARVKLDAVNLIQASSIATRQHLL